jgi:drug/metabolite transporter (DMT)-like permease
MKPATIVGILLIVLGVISLSVGGFNFTTQNRERVVDIGPLKVDATVKRERTLPLPPILGVCALAGGVVLLIAGSRKTA